MIDLEEAKVSNVGYQLFDSDSHVYEPRDAFTAYIDPKFRDQALRAVRDDDGTEIVVVGDRVMTFTDGNVFGNVHVPGTLKEKLLAWKHGETAKDKYYEAPRPSYLEPGPRVAELDAQNVEACLLFPALGLFVESFCRRTDVLYANVNAFNRWAHETWSFNYADRLFMPPAISLRDVDEAVKQVDWVIERGAQAVMLRTGPAYGRSPGDAHFDPVWARLNEAHVNVCYHITDSGYNPNVAVQWGEDANPRPYEQSAWVWMNCYGDRAIMDTLSALIYDNLFGRFPDIRVMSVEHGAEWVPYLLRRMDKMRGMARNGPWRGGDIGDRPSRIFNRHIKVVPYPEDDIAAIVAQAGSDWMVMGSDYPHGEGLAHPGAMPELCGDMSADDVKAICRDRGRAFVGLEN
jgi:predicted TIM-barrel fold metal-dependent hydrolase